MRFHHLIVGAALALTAALGAPLLALAQEAPAMTVDLAPVAQGVLSYVSAAIGVVVMGAIGLIGARIYAWTGVNIEAQHREALHSAIMTGVNAGLGKISDLIGGKAIDVRSTAAAGALRYVLASVPDAIRHFGLSEDRLQEMIAAKLTQVERERFGFEPAIELRSPVAAEQAG